MEHHQSPQEPEDPKAKLMREARDSYQQFDRLVTIQEGDSAWTVARKITLRILGIIVMILLSPFLLIGLAMAFATVF